ncbi:MAG: c-type cytochrome [Actinomycetota bacterium]
MSGILAVRLFAAGFHGTVNSPLVARVVLIVFAALLLAGCGGEKTVSPTGPVVGSLPTAAKGDPAKGKMVFNDSGCGGCHTFSAAGSTGNIGPDLDKVLTGKDATFIKTSITDPSAFVEKGYSDLMPKDYGTSLNSKQLADLVAFLQPG